MLKAYTYYRNNLHFPNFSQDDFVDHPFDKTICKIVLRKSKRETENKLYTQGDV